MKIFFTADISNFNLHEITFRQMAADYFTAKSQRAQRFVIFCFSLRQGKAKSISPAGLVRYFRRCRFMISNGHAPLNRHKTKGMKSPSSHVSRDKSC